MAHVSRWFAIGFMGLLFAVPLNVVAEEDFPRQLRSAIEKLQLTAHDYTKIAAYVSGQEFGQNPEGILDWNEGEAFPSLGIGHFIWFPQGVNPPYTESFPKMAKFIFKSWPQDSQLRVQDRLSFAYVYNQIYDSWGNIKKAPWGNRSDFLLWKKNRPEEFQHYVLVLNHSLMKALQASYLDYDFRRALVRIVEGVDDPEDLVSMEATSEWTLVRARQHIQRNILLLLKKKQGVVALMDYVNFKGDGLNEGSRYQRIGWGLQQVLFKMRPASGNAFKNYKLFSNAATAIMIRRAQLSGREIEQKRWIHGWVNRTLSYGYVDKDPEIVAMKKLRYADGSLQWPKLHIGTRALRGLF